MATIQSSLMRLSNADLPRIRAYFWKQKGPRKSITAGFVIGEKGKDISLILGQPQSLDYLQVGLEEM